jgi:hypothetical protein
MWTQLSNVFVMASLDGSHKRGDYMRKGQDWERTEANVQRMRKECPHVQFRLWPTVSVFNVLHLPDFYLYMQQRELIGVDDIVTNILLEPVFYSVRTLPPALKRTVTQRYDEFVRDDLTKLGVREETKDQFRAVVAYMNEEQLNALGKFRFMTRKLDALRKESFADTFPELRSLMSET